MSITITSTTDTDEAVLAATGDLAIEPVETDNESASAEETEESTEDSDTSEGTEESEDNESDDESESDDEDDEDKPKPKKKGGFKRRIDKLNSKLSAKEQELEYWRKQALERKDIDAEREQKQAPLRPDGKPSADDFDSHEEYVEALTDWKLEQKLSEREQKQKETELKTEFQKAVSTYQERVQEFKKSHKDFDRVIESAEDITLSLTVQDTLLTSELGPQLAYELSKNVEELERINALPPFQAARELGKLEAKLSDSSLSRKTEVKVSKAPKPINPVGSKSSGSSTKSIYDPDLSQKEYERLRNEQMRKGS